MNKKKLLDLREHCSGMTILYVEDEIEVRYTIGEILNNIFKTVLLAKNGEEGFELFKTSDVDIIITDITMPIKNGVEMSSQIRKLDDEIPIVVISANSDTKYFIDMIKIGVDGYLIKPLEHDQFINTIHKAMQKIILKQENYEYQYKLEVKVEDKTRELEERYYHDELTGLQNRFALLDDIKEYNAKKLILIDINKFSALNDVYGSKTGDNILKIVAFNLRQILNDDCKLYRVSADQFVFLSYKINIEETCNDFIEVIMEVLSSASIFVSDDNAEIEINISATISVAK